MSLGVQLVEKGKMTNFFDCSFARAAVKHYTALNSYSNGHLTAEEKRERHRQFLEQPLCTPVEKANGGLRHFDVPLESFDSAARRLLAANKKHWRGGAVLRQRWTTRFSPDAWKKLSRVEQLTHQRLECAACNDKYPALRAAVPPGKTRGHRSSTTDLDLASSPEGKKLRTEIDEQKKKQRAKAAARTARLYFDKAKEAYKENFPDKTERNFLEHFSCMYNSRERERERLV